MRSFRFGICVAALLAVPWAVLAQQQAEPLREPLPLQSAQSAVQDKNFYLLSLIERTPDVAKAVHDDTGLASIFKERTDAIEHAENNCGQNPDCTVDAAMLTPDEIDETGKRLGQLYDANQAVRDLVAGPMRQSGLFVLYRNEDDKTLLIHAWNDAAAGIDRILRVYGEGEKPHYYLIDSASFDMHSPAYWARLHAFVGSLSDTDLFFQPSLRFALMLLDLNHRDEAGRYEPMDKGINAATIAHLASIRWSDYPYTAILVPGAGPTDPNTPISPGGIRRSRLAAEQFKLHEAPLIITSGGFVHPSQTRFSEAIEMRRYLIEQCGVPADVILVDPHARHTTTNVRNADRLIYRYGIPFDRPVLAVTDPGQAGAILSPAFDARNMRELGYLPYTKKTRISDDEVSFYPSIDALQADARDPLDP